MSTTAHPGHHGIYGFGRVERTAERRGLGLRLLRGGGAALGTILLFVVALVAGALLHLNTPRARRLVMDKVNAALAPSFRGKITVRRIGGIGLFGLTGTDATIDDPSGHQVLSVRGLRVGIATIAAARSALLDRKNPIAVDVSGIGIDALDVRLDTDDRGNLELLDALASTKPSAPPDPNARGLRLTISRITLGHAWAHGQMGGAPPLDVDLDGFRGALTYAPDVLEADVAEAKITARRIASGADVAGTLRAHVKKPSDAKIHPEGRLAWDGTVGDIAHSIHASVVKDDVDAVIDVPQVSPDRIRAVWAESPIDQPAVVHVEAHGPLAGVDLDLHAGLGPAAFDAKGRLDLEDEKKADITFGAHHIDIHELAASAPRSRLGLTGTVSADMKPDGALHGDLALRFLGGNVGENAMPTASIGATVARTTPDDLHGHASIVVDEPGAPTRLDATVVPRGHSSAIDFQLASTVDDFQRVPQLAHGVYGRLALKAGGEVDLASRAIDAHLEANGAGIKQGTTHVQSVSLGVQARGPLASPDLLATVRMLGVVAGDKHFDKAEVVAQGDAMSPRVTASVRGPDTPDLDASVRVGLRGGLSLADLRAVLARAGERSVITVHDVRLAGGDVTVDGARIEGLGDPLTASVRMTPGTAHVRAASGGIDLARVARLAHLENSLQSGTIALDTDLHLQRTAGEGKLVLDAAHVSTGKAKDISAHVEMSMAGRKIVAKVHADLPGIAALDLDAPQIAFGGAAPLLGAAWKEAFGTVDVNAHADLTKLTAIIPPEDLGLGDARGKIALKGHLARDGVDDVTPDVNLTLSTDQLVLAPRIPQERDIDGVLVHPLPAWRLTGIDFDVQGTIDGDTGFLRMTTTARDARGPLAQVDAKTRHFPYGDLSHDRSRLMGDLRKTEFDVRLAVPERGLGGVPPILKQSYVRGKLQADVALTGTTLAPTLDVKATLRRASFSGNVMTTPFDVDVAAHYDGKQGTASVKARSRDQVLLDLEAQAEAAVAQFLAPTGAPPRWTASVKAHMASFPLESIAVLDDKIVSGKLTGDLSLADLHKDARLDANLAVDTLTVGSVHYKDASVVVKADGKVLDAAVRVNQPDGFLDTTAHAVASWGAAMAPALDPSQPLDASVSSKNFRIAALLPFADGVLDELDGRLDGNLKAELDPRVRAARLTGALALSRGTIEAAAGGGELHDLTANVKFAPDGTITLEKLTASGMTGRLEASAKAKLEGTNLQRAHAVLTIPGSSPVPLAAGGAELGNIDGRVEVDASAAPGGKGMSVKVEVPQLEVKLPEGSTTDAQALGPMDKVRIGAHRGDPAHFVLLPLDPTKKPVLNQDKAKPSSTVTLATHLGNVHVVKGTQLKVDLGGKVDVTSGDTSKVTGQIFLKKGGTLNVQGRTFTIENGTVTFVDDPGNPEVVIKAGWTAPDATVVYATFTGPLKTGKVTLSSEPTLPQEEIVQLLMFGSADGKQAQTPTSDSTDSAIATAGGEAAQPLNHMLNQLGLGAVTANVDTSDSANPKPEIQVQIAKQISLELAYVLGRPPPGVNPDTILLTLDWRMFKRWSLATTVGDAGTTIFDLLWQKRY